ncbi:glycosyltransferase family 4 protein [Candidatus Woesearchaeota archaeon]|nr:glycosyltransferase family 4 protein [Candidatus Woesearchaeota archaeon]
MHVIHHTPFDFPLDRHFLGESIIIGSLCSDPKTNTYVVSAGSNQSPLIAGLPPNYALPELLAQRQFSSGLARIAYRGCDSDYFDFIRARIKEAESPIILNYHFLRGDMDVTAKVKKEFRNDVVTVMHLHCMPDLYQADKYNQSSDKRTLNQLIKVGRVDGFIAVSNAVRTGFMYGSDIPQEKIVTVTNGVDEQLYQVYADSVRKEVRTRIGIKGEVILGYAGRMNENKGVSTFLEVLRGCERLGLEYGFVFAASNGAERQKFFRTVSEIAPGLIQRDQIKIVLDVSKLVNGSSGLDDAVVEHFRGQFIEEGISNSKIWGGLITRPVQGILDAYVHPAYSEAISLSILESLAQGVPVIGSNTGGIPDVVSDNMGTLVNINRPQERELEDKKARVYSSNAVKVMEAIDQLRERLFQRAILTASDMHHQVISRGHTKKRMLDKTLDLYVRLISRFV